MNNADELSRLLHGPHFGEKPEGLLVGIEAVSPADAAKILAAAREVWAIALQQADPDGTTLDEWSNLLPRWFVEKCGPEFGMEEAMRRRMLPMKNRIQLSDTWSLSGWVHWLKPAERHWSWWDAKVESPRLLRVQIVVDGSPFPSGSLQWLLKCCGASSVEVLN